jgi:ABC-type nitrate/sulfonate/bicarbonate transport system ATPase subunit
MFWLNARDNADLLCRLSPYPHKRRLRAAVDPLFEAYGLEAVTAQRPADLSGGQQQRLALVRAVAFSPRLLLLDEPFSALDGHTKARIFPTLRKTIEEAKMTCILVAHQNTDLAFFCDLIVPFSFTSGRVPGVARATVSLDHLRKPTSYSDLDAIRSRADYIRDQLLI